MPHLVMSSEDHLRVPGHLGKPADLEASDRERGEAASDAGEEKLVVATVLPAFRG